MAAGIRTMVKIPLSYRLFISFHPSHRQLSDQAIRCTNEGNLRDFVVSRNRVDTTPTLFFQKLGIPIDEFERKRWFKCMFVSNKLREEVFSFFLPPSLRFCCYLSLSLVYFCSISLFHLVLITYLSFLLTERIHCLCQQE